MSEPKSRSTRLRRLTDDEIELWLTVASTVARRPGSELPRPPVGAARLAVSATALPTPILPTPPAPKPHLPPLAPLERKLKQKLSRGRMTADAAIDLHGLRQGEAHAALLRFLDRGQRQGFKVVLVVTGKGGRVREDEWGIGEGTTGVLRRQVPLWLGLPEFRALVVGWEEAGPSARRRRRALRQAAPRDTPRGRLRLASRGLFARRMFRPMLSPFRRSRGSIEVVR